MLLRVLPRMQCRPLLYCIRSPNDTVSISFSLFHSAARETMLLTFSMVGHVPAWRMLLFIWVFYWTRWLTLSLAHASSVTTETSRAWLIERGWLKGPDASQQTGINRWIAKSQLTLSVWIKCLQCVHLSYCDLLMTFPSNIMKLFVKLILKWADTDSTVCADG